MEKLQKGLDQARNEEESAVGGCMCRAAGWCVITNHKCPYEGIGEYCPILLKIIRSLE